MKLATFDDVMRYLLPQIIQRRYVDKAACREICPDDMNRVLSILETSLPSSRYEEEVLGYLTSICAERLARSGEPLRLSRQMNYIGYCLEEKKSRIEIAGDAADFLGAYMKAGSIVCMGSCGGFAFKGATGGEGSIEGDAGDFCAEEIGDAALVRVLGNVGRSAGRRMCGGELVIQGDAGEFFCRYMEGGIARAGEIALLGETYGGEIHARRVRTLEKGDVGVHKAQLFLGPDPGSGAKP